MKSYFVFFVFLVAIIQSGCTPTLEDNVRILVMGNVEDQNGNAIQNAEISVFTNRGSYYSSSQSAYLLGQGISGADGSFSVVSFFVMDNEFSIFVRNGQEYSEYIYETSTLNYTPDDLTFDLQTVTIRKLADVDINIDRASPQGTTFSYHISYPFTYCWEFYNEGVLDAYQSSCYSSISNNRNLSDDNPDDSQSFQTLLGSTVEFTYSINGQPEETQVLTIDQENYEFNFSY